MTKADIINKIADNTGLQKKDVAVVVESFMESIKDSLLSNKETINILINKNLKLCLTERKKRDTRWLLTSVRRDYARTDTRASK